MKAIGGYPELELRNGEHYHKDAIKLNTARNCLEYILLARKYRKVHVPYYTCEAVHESFKKPGTFCRMEFYRIDGQLDPVDLPKLKVGEAFLYTNYFGLKQDMVERLASFYGNRLIVDNSQAFYDMPLPGIDTFYSARKFFGVPDGAYLYTDAFLEECYGYEIKADYSFERMTALLKRIDVGAEAGYSDFQKIESQLCQQPIKRMSRLTEAILASIDYESIRMQRRQNYKTLYWRLFQKNGCWFKLNDEAVPLCYPFLANDSSLRGQLIADKVFIPTYWPNVTEECACSTVEFDLATNLIPLPIDQRYGSEDMQKIINIINNQI